MKNFLYALLFLLCTAVVPAAAGDDDDKPQYTLSVNGKILEAKDTIRFGEVAVGAEKVLEIEVTNTGSEQIKFESGGIRVISGDTEMFSVAEYTPKVGAGAKGMIRIAFRPQGTGPYLAGIEADHSGSGEKLFYVRGLGGQLADPRAKLRPEYTPLNFPEILVNAISPAHTVDITNEGDREARIDSVVFQQNIHFRFSSGQAPNWGPIGTSQKRTLSLQFTPKQAGLWRDSVIVYYQKKPGEGDSVIVALSGLAKLPPPLPPARLRFSKQGIDFGTVYVGEEKLDSVYLVNRGGRAAEDINIAIDPKLADNNYDFSPKMIAKIGPDDSVMIYVRYRPQNVQDHNPRLRVVWKDMLGEGPDFLNLEGKGELKPVPGPELVLDDETRNNANTVNFGDVPAGKNKEKTFRLINKGKAEAHVSELVLSDTDNFEIVSPKGPFTIAPYEDTAVVVRFTPKSDKFVFAEKLGIRWDKAEIKVNLIGKQLVRAWSIESAGLKFDTTWVDSTPNEQIKTLKLSNTGNVKLSMQVALAAPSDVFEILTAMPLELGPDQPAEIRVRFRPDDEGPFSAVMKVSVEDETRLVNLSGVGRKKENPGATVYAGIRFTTDRPDSLIEIGKTFTIYMIADSVNDKFADLENVRCRASVSFNATVMTPLRYRENDSVSGNVRVITFDSTYTQIRQGDTLYRLEMMALFGNSDSSSISLAKLEMSLPGGNPVDGKFVSGEGKVYVANIRPGSGKAFLDADQSQLVLAVTPNVLGRGEHTFIAAANYSGAATLKVYSSSGAEVADLSSMLDRREFTFQAFEFEELGSGMYYCVLASGGNITVKPFAIAGN